MQKSSVGISTRIALGIALVWIAGCGGSSGHPASDANDASDDSLTGSAGGGGNAGTGGIGGAAGASSDGAAGMGGAAGASADGAAGTGGAAGASADGAAANDGAASASDGAAGNDGAAGGTTDGGVDAVEAADAADATDATEDASVDAEDGGDAGDAACQNACTLGAMRCGPNGGIETCVTGQSTCTVWGTEAACGTHQVCGASGSSVACACKTSSCTTAGDFCSSATEKTTCAVDGDGCFFATAGPTACGSHQSCSGAAGSATCTCNVDPNCASGTDTFCASTTSESFCASDADHCFFVDHTTSCGGNQTCTGSRPTGACTCNAAPPQCTADGVTFCDSNGNSETCKKDGNGCFTVTTTTCGSHQTCNATSGQCACNASACGQAGSFCDGSGKLVTCASDANNCVFVSAGPTSCTANETCTGASPNAACTCNAAPSACAGGAAGKFCTNGTSEVTTCTADAHQCVTIASVQTCGARQTCTGTPGNEACVCNAAPAGCTGSGTFCDSTGTQASCVADADNCLFAQSSQACPAHETCKGSTLGSTCTCDSTCTAGQVGTYCVDGATQASCTNDTNGCHISSGNATCPGLQTCRTTSGANGACQCPAAGAVVGTGCTTPGTTLCAGNFVLTCVTEVSGGCNTWQMPNDCTTTSLVCGTKSGVAACQCPDHTGTDFFVDAGQGTAAASGLFATGITSPAECRFQKLGDALAVATAGGDRVVATSAGGTGTFSAETFPLTVSAGVTLTTSDTVPTPANYTIEFASAGAPAAVSLGNSTVFEGFTIANGGGNAAAAAVSLTGTGVTVDTVDLEGTGNSTTLADVSSVSGAGQGLVNDVKIDGFTTGFALGTSGAASQLNNSMLTSNATGIAITNGTLTAATDTVNGGTKGIVISGPGTSLPTLNGTALTVENETGAGISQTSSGGTPTLSLTGGELAHNGGGGIASASGNVTLAMVNVHDNTGAGVSASAGTVSIGATGTATMVQNNTVNGIDLTGGTLTVGAANVTGNGSDGLFASAGTVTLNTGGQFTSNGGAGINVATTLNINGSAASPNIASNNTGDGINVTAGTTTANYLTLNANGTGTTKKSGLEISGPADLSLGVNTDAVLLFENNGLDGINVNGTTAASVLDVRKVQVTGNTGDGVSVDLNSGSATFTSLTLSGNTGNGVEVIRAPLVGSSTKLTMDTLTVSGNGGNGIYLHATTGNVAAIIKNGKITSNTGFGLRFDEVQGTNTTQETIQNNDVSSNTGGGIDFHTQSLLNGFTGNTVHSNTSDQILVEARQTGNATWVFHSATNTCDSTRNQVYCYGANGGVHVSAVTGAATSIDAEYMSWANASPTLTSDYVNSGASNNVVTVTFPCAAVTSCP